MELVFELFLLLTKLVLQFCSPIIVELLLLYIVTFPLCIGLVEVEVIQTTTEKPVETSSCKPCECNCNQSESSVAVDTNDYLDG